MMDRIEFEELNLKSMEPSLGPKLSKFGKPELQELLEVCKDLRGSSFFQTSHFFYDFKDTLGLSLSL